MCRNLRHILIFVSVTINPVICREWKTISSLTFRDVAP